MSRNSLPTALRCFESIVDCQRIALVSAPLTPEIFLSANRDGALHRASGAPNIWQGWSQTRERLLGALKADRLPVDSVLLAGDADPEREWCAAGKLAGYLPADRYFPGRAV